MTDGGKIGSGGNTGSSTTGDMMGVNQQGQVMLTQQNMASLQHQQALQMQQQQQQQQQQASMEMQTSQAQSVNQAQTLLVNTANLHQQLQNAGGGGGSGNTGTIVSQPVSQSGGTTMCLQQQAIQSSMASNQNLHQPQQIGSISLQGTNVGGNQSGSTTITTMSTLPQQQQSQQPQQLQQVQVIQQPMQNAYVQQLYNHQGQMLMSALHPNMNPGSIQVIAAGKPFQSNQLTSHVLSKPVLAANTQQGSFSSYATIPTTTNQTLVITGGQLGVISGQLPQTQAKPPDLQKTGGGNSTGVKTAGGNSGNNQQQVLQNCVASHPTMLHHLISPIQYTTCGNGRQGTNQTQATQAVQIASPWQFPHIPQVWTAATQSHHPQLIQNPIFIRGSQQDQPMFIQQPPPPTQSIQQQAQQQQGVTVGKQEMKTVSSPQVSRTLSILPSTSMTPPIRPATSASTQIVKSQQIKMRTKAILTKSNIPPQKLDAQNQTKPGVQATTVSSQIPQQILPATTKMIITSQGTIVQGPIENKLVGQVANTGQAQTTVSSVPQGAVTMQHAAAAISMQPGTVVHQPQLIQPKPPPLMSLSMPSLEPIPVSQNEKSLEAVASMEVISSPAPTTQINPVPTNIEQQERLSEPMQQDETVNHAPSTVTPLENGQESIESKGPENMEVVEASATPPHPPPSMTPVQNGLPANSNGLATASPTTVLPANTGHARSSPSPTVALPHSGGIQVCAQTQMEENKTKKTPKAMVKPHSQVLTHIIEGYVIQESSEPFPINRTNLLSDLTQSAKAENHSMDSSDEPPAKKPLLDQSIQGESDTTSDKLKCETCGKIDLKEKFMKKKFCSVNCTLRGSTSGRRRSKSKETDSKNDKEWVEGEAEPANLVSAGDTNSESSSEPLSNPIKWTVQEVCDFIKNLPGCTDYAEDFAIQEIDGQALMLLKADHLMSAMSMKLGPALKICAKIDTMRSEAQANSQTTPVV